MNKLEALMQKRTKTEVYSRVCGYLRPIFNWNDGKQQEFKDRKEFKWPTEKSQN